MRTVIRENMKTAYCLHDMNVTAFETNGNKLTMRTQSGMIKTSFPCTQVDGYVEFEDVRWEFSYVYLLGVTGNTGVFKGEKLFLRDFFERFPVFGFSVMDETYGYNTTKYSGFLLSNRCH